MPEQETGEFQFQLDMDTWTQIHVVPSPAQKLKCSFLDFVQLLMIGRAGQWTQTPTATPLQPKK